MVVQEKQKASAAHTERLKAFVAKMEQPGELDKHIADLLKKALENA